MNLWHKIVAQLVRLPHVYGGTLAFLTFAFIGIALYVGESIEQKKWPTPVGLFKFWFPMKEYWSHSSRVDIFVYFIGKFTQKFNAFANGAILAFIISWLVQFYRTTYHIQPLWKETWWAVAICTVLAFLGSDFGEFYSHYVQHHVPWLWELHKVHHAATCMNPLTATRFHPLGNFMDGLWMALGTIPAILIAELCFGMTKLRIVEMMGGIEFFFTLTFLRQLQHSHYPISFGVFNKILVCPVAHQVHHSVKREHWDMNYGSRLSIWDRLFKCEFILPEGEALTFGLGTIEDERGDYKKVSSFYLKPMFGMVREFQIATARLLGLSETKYIKGLRAISEANLKELHSHAHDH